MIAVSRELGVCKSTLKYWQRQAARGGLSESQAMAVADLELQREILKKALSMVQSWPQHNAGS